MPFLIRRALSNVQIGHMIWIKINLFVHIDNSPKCDENVSTYKKEASMNHTIYDIAKACGYSIATVSRVVNKQEGVKPETRQKVLETIERLNYAPSPAARSLAGKRAKILGIETGSLLQSKFETDFPISFLNGAVRAATEHDYRLLLSCSEDSLMDSQSAFSIKNLEGIIFPGLHGNGENVKTLLEAGVPVVYGGMRQDFDQGPVAHNIYGGYLEYREMVLEHLIDMGYRHILVAESDLHLNDTLASRGIRDVIDRANRKLKAFDKNAYCILERYSFADLSTISRKFLTFYATDYPPDALFLDSIDTYLSLSETLHKVGLEVPEDMGVIAASHMPGKGENLTPRLSTVYIDAYEMGRRSVELLISQLEETDEKVNHNVPYSLHIRDSLMSQDQ